MTCDLREVEVLDVPRTLRRCILLKYNEIVVPHYNAYYPEILDIVTNAQSSFDYKMEVIAENTVKLNLKCEELEFA